MIDRDNLEDVYPLSPMQEGMLFHSVLEQGSRAYVEQFSFRLYGAFEREVFAATWSELFRRHQVLRTAFVPDRAKRPLQIVLKAREPEIEFEDLTADPTDVPRTLADARAAELARGFDLTTDSLIRFEVFKLGPDTHEIIWTMHHIILDGWSVGVLQSEFMQIYRARCRADTHALPPSPGYNRYIAWLEARDQNDSLDYWASYLDGYTELASLPRRSRSRIGDGDAYQLDRHTIALDSGLGAKLRALASACNATLNSTLQASWGLVLSRYNDTDDVAFGAVVSGRPAELPDIDRMVGLFINAIPVRVRLARGMTPRSLIHVVQSAALEREPHQYCSLGEIQARSELKQSLLDHLLVVENYPVSNALSGSSEGFRIEVGDCHEQTNYDFVVVVTPGDTIRIEFQFNALVMDADLIARVSRHWLAVLGEFAAAPDEPIDVLEMMEANERGAIVSGFNRTATAYPRDDTVVDRFEAQVRATPHAVAVKFDHETLTYAELDVLANRLAHRLRTLGVTRETPVGLCLPRSIETIVTLLAVLKAGGAYVPLNPDDPPARRAAVIAMMSAPVLVTAHDDIAFEGSAVHVIMMSDVRAVDGADVAPARNLDARNLAYVCFTSGSTGRPKGVRIPHRAVVRLVTNTDYAHFAADEVFLHFAPLGFDAATFEIWGALLNGATAVIAPPGRMGLEELGACIRRDRITTVWLTSGLFHLMVEERLADLRDVRHVLTGGDVLSMAHVRQMLDEAPRCRLANCYGPTENTTFSTCHPFKSGDRGRVRAPIGRPIANSQAYVLDRDLRPVPVDVAGELFVAGDGLARDYLADPRLTAARFVPNPFAAEPGERMYRTGDLVQFEHSGGIDFLGRIDYQLKIRGFRLEPAEVEGAIIEHPDVTDALVVARPRSRSAQNGLLGTDKRLVAYVVAPRAKLTPAELNAYLTARLPDFAVPSVFVFIAALPLNSIGKIDRAALPDPNAAVIELAVSKAPDSETERSIHAIWCEVLGLERIPIDASFFEAGGHSLSATQVISRLRSALAVEMPLRVVFEHPTIETLARAVDAHRAAPQPERASPALTLKARSRA